MRKLSIDGVLLHRFLLLLRVLFPKFHRLKFPSTYFLAFLVFTAAIADQVATYYVGILSSEFYVALGDRNLATFRRLILKSALLIIAKATVLAASKYFTSIFALKCRELCAKTLHKLYFTDCVYYRLDARTEHFDNPSGLMGPAAIYLYFIASTIINKLLLSPIVSLVNEQEKCEGDLRARHLEVRNNVEPLAFYRSGQTENTFTNSKLDKLLQIQRKLAQWRSLLCLATSLFDYYGATLGYLLIAIPIFMTQDYDSLSGSDLSGVISKNVFFYLYLIYSFTRLVTLAETFGDMAGVCHRVMGLYEGLVSLCSNLQKEIDGDKDGSITSQIKSDEQTDEKSNGYSVVNVERCGDHSQSISLSVEEKTKLLGSGIKASDGMVTIFCKNPFAALNNVSISSPTDSSHLLIQNLTMLIECGKKILITGDSSTGKTSILRVLAGLWKCTTGNIEWFLVRGISNVLFVPQNLYFPSGGTTLREQLTYPSRPLNDQSETRRLMTILSDLRLDGTIKRFSSLDNQIDGDWNEMLSRGELQRLTVGRVLNHRPQVVFLDECTSAVGVEMQSIIYNLIIEANVTFVSIGHRVSLQQFHDTELHLNGDGGWSISKIGGG